MHIQTQVFKLKKAPEKKNGAFILKTTVLLVLGSVTDRGTVGVLSCVYPMDCITSLQRYSISENFSLTGFLVPNPPL